MAVLDDGCSEDLEACERQKEHPEADQNPTHHGQNASHDRLLMQ
jgi:hypothetical protein